MFFSNKLCLSSISTHCLFSFTLTNLINVDVPGAVTDTVVGGLLLADPRAQLSSFARLHFLPHSKET